MQTKLAVLLLIALAAGCENRRADADHDETGAAGDRTGVDTVITTDKIKDTTVIRADTSIDVDTVKDTDHIKKENR